MRFAIGLIGVGLVLVYCTWQFGWKGGDPKQGHPPGDMM
jgi:hypothetical protein